MINSKEAADRLLKRREAFLTGKEETEKAEADAKASASIVGDTDTAAAAANHQDIPKQKLPLPKNWTISGDIAKLEAEPNSIEIVVFEKQRHIQSKTPEATTQTASLTAAAPSAITEDNLNKEPDIGQQVLSGICIDTKTKSEKAQLTGMVLFRKKEDVLNPNADPKSIKEEPILVTLFFHASRDKTHSLLHPILTKIPVLPFFQETYLDRPKPDVTLPAHNTHYGLYFNQITKYMLDDFFTYLMEEVDVSEEETQYFKKILGYRLPEKNDTQVAFDRILFKIQVNKKVDTKTLDEALKLAEALHLKAQKEGRKKNNSIVVLPCGMPELTQTNSIWILPLPLLN